MTCKAHEAKTVGEEILALHGPTGVAMSLYSHLLGLTDARNDG